MFLEGEVGFWAENGGLEQSYTQVNGKNAQKMQKNRKNEQKCAKMNKNAQEMSRNGLVLSRNFFLPACLIDFVRYSILDARYLMLDAGCSMLDAQGKIKYQKSKCKNKEPSSVFALAAMRRSGKATTDKSAELIFITQPPKPDS